MATDSERVNALEMELDRLRGELHRSDWRYQVICMILKDALAIVANIDPEHAKQMLARVPRRDEP